MEDSTRPRRQGAALVFILLAVIALLAIAIVFLSQMSHRDSAIKNDKSGVSDVMDTHPTDPGGDTSSSDTAIGDTPDSSSPAAMSEETPATPIMAFPPPPPTAIVTPNAAHLPPEG